MWSALSWVSQASPGDSSHLLTPRLRYLCGLPLHLASLYVREGGGQWEKKVESPDWKQGLHYFGGFIHVSPPYQLPGKWYLLWLHREVLSREILFQQAFSILKHHINNYASKLWLISILESGIDHLDKIFLLLRSTVLSITTAFFQVTSLSIVCGFLEPNIKS